MSRTVMVVDDNPTDEKLTVRAFRKSPHVGEIVVARDGAEALDYLFSVVQHTGSDLSVPALVLLDLKLPRIDGLEVLRRIRADNRTRLLPIVILTASNEAEDVLRSYSLGANAYLRKPVDFARFVEAAHAIGVFWLSLNEPPPLHRGVV